MRAPPTPAGAAGNNADIAPEATHCFHCGEPLVAGRSWQLLLDGHPRQLCCPGCLAVAQTILAAGHGAYYRHRTQPAARADAYDEALGEAELYAHPRLRETLVTHLDEQTDEAQVLLEGITCAACVWLIERALQALPGVIAAEVNYASQRATVRWDARRTDLAGVIRAVSTIGYRALPSDPDSARRLFAHERRVQLRRLGIATLLGMQIMTLAVALHLGDFYGMDAQFRIFFRWVSLVLTVPLVSYAAAPFFAGAWRDLRRHAPGMDVPVAAAIALAFAASAWATLDGAGAVYYDSIAMFVCLLLGARWFEFRARAQAADSVERLIAAAPQSALRLAPAASGGRERVPALALRPGDRVLVRPGEVVPADGTVVDGCSTLDQSLLTGESTPQPVAVGDGVIAGSVNASSPVTVTVTRAGADTALSAIVRLAERARTVKPAIAHAADRVARWFVTAVLILAAAVALAWYRVEPGAALTVTIAVLIVSCPCALSLATPAALAAALGRLLRGGVLVTRAHALETLAKVDHVVFDKTGTLTGERPGLREVRVLGSASEARCRRIAAALERDIAHPLAHALRDAAPAPAPLDARAVHAESGGVSGIVEGEQYWLGSVRFVANATALAVAEQPGVLLASRRELLARFAFDDALRPGARALLRALRRQGCRVSLYTGDSEAAARRVASTLLRALSSLTAGARAAGGAGQRSPRRRGWRQS